MSASTEEAMPGAVSPDVTLPIDVQSFDDPHPDYIESDNCGKRRWVGSTVGAVAARVKQTLFGDLYTEFASEKSASDANTIPPRQYGRREFLKLSGRAATIAGATALAAYAYEAAELSSGIVNAVHREEMELWPHNEPTFQFLGTERYQDQKQLAIYLPGFGDMHSKDEAELWHETSGVPDLLTGYVDYSNEGTDIQTIVKLIREKVDIDKIESITLVCRSIGGLFALPIAAELGIPVQSLLLMSSPSRLENGDMGEYGRVLARLPRWEALATFGKFVANAYHSYSVHGFHPSENFDEGWDSTMSGASPVALQTELRTAASIDIQAALLQPKLQKVFIPGFSRVIYAATNHPATDQTVHVTASGNEFREEFERLGIDCELVGIPYDGHANVQETAHFLGPWTRSATSPNNILAVGR